MADHQICLVSGQPLPNLLGALAADTGAMVLHLVVSPAMTEQAKTLKQLLRRLGRQVFCYPLDRPHDPDSMFALLEEIHTKALAMQAQKVCLNATGGTKLMALSAVEWAAMYGDAVPVFYVDIENDTVVTLGSAAVRHPLSDVLTVDTLLHAYGYTVEKRCAAPVSQERRQVLDRMVRLCRGDAKIFSILNGCAASGYSRGELCVHLTHTPSGNWRALLDCLQQAGLVSYGNGMLCFASESDRRWCNGIWLEEYVQSVLFRMQHSGKIRDWATSVQVHHGHVKNELDALFTARNRLFVIECKTSLLEAEQGQTPVYKLDALHSRLGGIFAQGMLVSARELPSSVLQRCRDYHVRVVAGEAVFQLEETLCQWITRAR